MDALLKVLYSIEQNKYTFSLWDLVLAPKHILYSWFFEVLQFHEWLIFSFFMILFSQMGLPKAQALQWVVHFFEGLNFMIDQHP